MILVVGAGFLGTYLLKYLSDNTDFSLLAAVREPKEHPPFSRTEYIKCDIREPKDVAALARRCNGEKLTVFYFAALHNVDYLYEHPHEGRKINIDALSFFLNTVPNIEKFFFASTDCVYGENANSAKKFTECDMAAPVNEYGRQKLEAEKIVSSFGFTSVRFAYMLGASMLPKRHFYDKICKSLSCGETVEMIDGMVRSAIFYENAARLLAMLSFLPTEKLPGTVNLCSDNEYSKYELGLYIAKKHGLSAELIKKISEKQAESFFAEKRAQRAAMDNSLLKELLHIEKIGLEETCL